MISWRKQGPALVGSLSLTDGRPARVVVMGPRDNPKGAVVALPAHEGRPQVVPLEEVLSLLEPDAVVSILCVQERAHGTSGLEPPEVCE